MYSGQVIFGKQCGRKIEHILTIYKILGPKITLKEFTKIDQTISYVCTSSCVCVD